MSVSETGGRPDLAVQLAELPNELFRSLVHRCREDDLDFRDEIAAAAGRTRRAAAAHPHLLRCLGAGGNPDVERSLERRYLDASAEHRLVHAHGDRHVDVVADTAERRMGLHVHRDVEIPGPAAVPAGVAARRDAHARSVLDAGRDADRDTLAPYVLSRAEADGTAIALLAPGAGARRAPLGEHHVAPRPPDASGPAAVRTASFR